MTAQPRSGSDGRRWLNLSGSREWSPSNGTIRQSASADVFSAFVEMTARQNGGLLTEEFGRPPVPAAQHGCQGRDHDGPHQEGIYQDADGYSGAYLKNQLQ
jgi:hypothetical protein